MSDRLRLIHNIQCCNFSSMLWDTWHHQRGLMHCTGLEIKNWDPLILGVSSMIDKVTLIQAGYPWGKLVPKSSFPVQWLTRLPWSRSGYPWGKLVPKSSYPEQKGSVSAIAPSLYGYYEQRVSLPDGGRYILYPLTFFYWKLLGVLRLFLSAQDHI